MTTAATGLPMPASGGSKRLVFLAHFNVEIPDTFFDPIPEEELMLWEDGEPDDPVYTGKARK